MMVDPRVIVGRRYSMTDKKDKPVWEEGVAIKERQKVKKPRLYKVLLHNDDYTTMEFVVLVLRSVFHMDESAAGGNGTASGGSSSGTRGGTRSQAAAGAAPPPHEPRRSEAAGALAGR